MFRLLTIEFHKLRYNKASKILSIIYFGLLTSIALIAAIKFEFGDFKLHLADAGIFNFPYIWHFNTYVAAILKFFLLLVIVCLCYFCSFVLPRKSEKRKKSTDLFLLFQIF